MSRGDDPVPIGESLGQVVRSLRGPERGRPDAGAGVAPGAGAPSAATLGGVFGRWDEVVGEAVARHAQPVKLDGDRLVVEVDDPAWATQLRFLEATLLARLTEALGPSSIPVRSFEIRVAGRR